MKVKMILLIYRGLFSFDWGLNMRCVLNFLVVALVGTCGCGQGPAPQVPAWKKPAVAKPKTDPAIAEKFRKERLEFVRRTTVLDYDRVGRKDPRWDADARTALECIAQIWSNYSHDQEILRTCNEAAVRAITAGCDDPLVLYVRARADPTAAVKNEPIYAAVIEKMGSCDYAPSRKANFLMRRAQSLALVAKKPLAGPVRAEIVRVWEEAVKLLAKSEAEPDEQPALKTEHIYDTGEELVDFYVANIDSDRKVGLEKVYQALIAAAPQSAAAHMIKGEAYISYAWDARGDGYANTVTPEGWRLMKERLEVSASEFEQAWKLLPTSKTAELFVRLELGRNTGRKNMEQWFARAMELNPNNSSVCDSKMYYLEPKWHGSAEEMIEFGRECLADGNWQARIPLQLISAHSRLMRYSKPPENYLKDPEVWNDIKAVYEKCLELNPKSTFDRSYFAFYACYCDHPEVAHKQFQILGDNVSLEPFGDRNRLDAFRNEAAYRAGQK